MDLSFQRLLLVLSLIIFIESETASQCDFKVIAHRGSSYNYPENTLIAIEQAYLEGAWACEIDVRRTSDNVLILMHDSLVDRTTNGKGAVSKLPSSFIKTLDAGSWKAERFAGTEVPTLLEAIEIAKKYNRKLYLDMKVDAVPLLAKTLLEANAPADIIIPDPASLRSIEEYHTYMPATPLCYFGEPEQFVNDQQFYEFLSEHNVIAVETVAGNIFEEMQWIKTLRDSLHNKGLDLWVYTVNNIGHLDIIQQFGIDGLETDVPASAHDKLCNTLKGGYFPEKRITGQWDFINSNLSATIGSAMNLRGDTSISGQKPAFGSCNYFGIPLIDGADAEVMFVPALDSEHYLEFYSNIAPQGNPGGLSCDNDYSILMDILIPPDAFKPYISLLQTAYTNYNDADIFINKSGAIGIMGQYFGKLSANTWHRIAMVFDLPSDELRIFIDGAFKGTVYLEEESLDGRFCINNNWGVQASSFFSDDDGETAELYVNSIQIRDYAMTGEEISNIGKCSAEKIPVNIDYNFTDCPNILINPRDTITCEGSEIVLKAEAESQLPDSNYLLNYKWQVNKGNDWEDITGNIYSETGSAELKISPADKEISGNKYRCIVSDLCSVTTNHASVSIEKFLSDTIFPSEPKYFFSCKNNSLTLNPFKDENIQLPKSILYQWYKDNAPVKGAMQSSYTILKNEMKDAGIYRLVLSDYSGCSKTSPAVICGISNHPKSVILPLEKSDFCKGEIAMLSADTGDYENFETSDFSAYQWQHSGDSFWKISTNNPFSDNYSAVSGSVSHLQKSELHLETYNTVSDSISFYLKVSSELNFDFLYFYINDLAVGRWSGEVDWKRLSFVVKPGNNSFRWGYLKDKNLSSGSDCAWIDNIVFPGNCPQEHLSFQWQKNGEDIYGANANKLIISEEGEYQVKTECENNCSAMSSTKTINFNALPVVNLGNDTVILNTSKFHLDAGEGFSSYLWNNGNTTQIIEIDSSNLMIGDNLFSVTVTNSTGCSGSDTIVITYIENNFSIYGKLVYNNLLKSPLINTRIYCYTENNILKDSTMTDNAGLFTFIGLRAGKYIFMPKVTYEWGGGNTIDAMLITNFYTSFHTFPDNLSKKAADVDENGMINPMDAFLVNRRYILSYPFNTNDWLFDNNSVTIDKDNIEVEILSICAGDVNASYNP